jgi:hypothetical protein
VNTASTILLGLIAVATVVMAAVQIGLIVFAVRLSKRIEVLSTQIEREIGPLAERLTRVADNLQHATGLASAQVERVDRLFTGAGRGADATMALMQGAVAGPFRQGIALIAAVRAVVGAFRSLRGGRKATRQQARAHEDDPLFIG